MAFGVRIRVTWDGTIIEDRIHFEDRIFIGAGPLARVVVPAEHGRYAVVTRRGAILELRVARGTMDSVEFPGEQAIDATALDEPLVRRLAPPFGAGTLRVGGAVVEFERWGKEDGKWDGVLVGLAAGAAALAFLFGVGYPLVRMVGDGRNPTLDKPLALNERDASRMRVQIGPDGLGAMRPQAGQGAALHGRSDAHEELPPAAVVQNDEEQPSEPARPRVPDEKSTNPNKVATGKSPTHASENATTDEVTPPKGPTPSRSETLESAQAALLDADLRKAIDGYSRAAKQSPLDYDQLNWLGLAHYLVGEYDQAQKIFEQARDLDAHRADAFNNLSGIASRKGESKRAVELLRQAVAAEPDECHSLNSLSLALAKTNDRDEAERTLDRSDGLCGGHYAYTNIQRAGMKALAGDLDAAFTELELGLSRVDTMIPIKEYEVWADLRLDPAFAQMRSDPRFQPLLRKYLPRASKGKS